MCFARRCPIHGDEHYDFACPDRTRTEKLAQMLPLAECKIHKAEHANCLCPSRDPLECAREMLEFVLGKEATDAWFLRPHSDLNGRTPQDFINAGGADLIRDFVAKMFQDVKDTLAS